MIPALDLATLGALIRLARTRHGHRQGEAFCQRVLETTGMGLSVDTLYRIECGKQEPTLSQFMAINIALERHMLDDRMVAASMAAKNDHLVRFKDGHIAGSGLYSYAKAHPAKAAPEGGVS